MQAVRVETYGRENGVALGEDVSEDSSSEGVRVAARAKQSK